MTEQRVNVVAWDDMEVTLQLDKSMHRTISTRTEQYKRAAKELDVLKGQHKIGSYDLAGDRSLTFTFHQPGDYDAIKSKLLTLFIIGVGETAGDVAFYEIGADEPFERGKVLINAESGQRRYEKSQVVTV